MWPILVLALLAMAELLMRMREAEQFAKQHKTECLDVLPLERVWLYGLSLLVVLCLTSGVAEYFQQ